jgi:hypothetical protein
MVEPQMLALALLALLAWLALAYRAGSGRAPLFERVVFVALTLACFGAAPVLGHVLAQNI